VGKAKRAHRSGIRMGKARRARLRPPYGLAAATAAEE
jgi:hypothetical protein